MEDQIIMENKPTPGEADNLGDMEGDKIVMKRPLTPEVPADEEEKGDWLSSKKFKGEQQQDEKVCYRYCYYYYYYYYYYYCDEDNDGVNHYRINQLYPFLGVPKFGSGGVGRGVAEGLAQWLRSLPPNPEVPSSIPGLVEG